MPEISPIYMRMKQSVTWMKQNKSMLQKDIAEKMGMTDVSFSRGMERIKLKRDEDFIISFHQATERVFSLDWLLNGEGDMFSENNEAAPQPSSSQPDSDILELYARMIRKLDDTRIELQKEIAEVRQLRDELRLTLSHLSGTTYQIPDETPRLAAEELKN